MVKFRADKEVDEIVEPILKYCIIAYNLLTFLICFGFIIGGSWLLYEFNKIIGSDTNFAGVYNLTFDLSVFALIVGIVGVIMTSAAIAATYRENIFVLKLYMIILGLIVIMCMITGVTFLIFEGKITQTITSKLGSKYITQYSEDEVIKTVYDTIQKEYSCCGIQDYKDWNFNPYYNCTVTSKSAYKCMVPFSCCIDQTDDTNLFCSNLVLQNKEFLTNIHQKGCSSVIVEKSAYGITVMASVIIGCAILIAINIVLVQWLVMLIQREKALYNAKYQRVPEES